MADIQHHRGYKLILRRTKGLNNVFVFNPENKIDCGPFEGLEERIIFAKAKRYIDLKIELMQEQEVCY